MLEFLADWWPFLLLIYLPRVINVAMHVWALAVRYRLDHDFPDDLPMTAGEWLQKKLAEFPLGNRDGQVRVVVTSKDSTVSIDGFHPREGVIQLTEETYFKRDPIFWAIAGHELGHALTWRRFPLLTRLFVIAGWLKWALATFGLAILFGNVLYGLPEVTDLAYYCIGVALVLDLFVLIDEALASAVADQLLAREPVLTTEHVRAARMMLIAAFMTYLSTFVAHAGLFTFFPRLVELIGDGRFDGVAEPLAGWRWLLALVATVLATLYALLKLLHILMPPPYYVVRDNRPVNLVAPIETLHYLIQQITLLVLLVLLWDQSADPRYWWCVLLAFVPALGGISMLLSLPLMVVFMQLAKRALSIKQRFGGIDESPAYRKARIRGLGDIKLGNGVIADIIVRSRNNPPWPRRLAWFSRILYVPLLIAFWLIF